MTVEAIKKRVASHIANARTQEALAILHEWAAAHGSITSQTVVNLISSDWNELKREEIMGVARDVNRRRAEINLRILQFNWEANAILPQSGAVMKEMNPQETAIIHNHHTINNYGTIEKQVNYPNIQGDLNM